MWQINYKTKKKKRKPKKISKSNEKSVNSEKVPNMPSFAIVNTQADIYIGAVMCGYVCLFF